ncbi:MAG: (Fe-S)-binding protein [Candidatus Bathyarchaeia archaeon]
MKANLEDVLKCAICPNMCRFACPVLDAEKSESTSPSGRMRIAYLMETDKLHFSRDAVELMYKCAGCSACQFWCPFEFDVSDLSLGVREDIVDKNKVPPAVVQLIQDLEKSRRLYGTNSTVQKLMETSVKEADVLFFVGCVSAAKRPEVVKSTVEILKKAEVDFTMISDEWCCGAPAGFLGFAEVFRRFAEHNAEDFEKTGCKTVICDCPGCAYTLKELYPLKGVKLGQEILHSSQFFLKLIKEKLIKPKVPNKQSYVFHDPCLLARKLNIESEPREVLTSIPRLKLREPRFTGKETWCCGNGGTLRVVSPKTSRKITDRRLQELKAISNFVISACPTCEVTFKDADERGEAEVFDISEILLKSLTKV